MGTNVLLKGSRQIQHYDEDAAFSLNSRVFSNSSSLAINFQKFSLLPHPFVCDDKA